MMAKLTNADMTLLFTTSLQLHSKMGDLGIKLADITSILAKTRNEIVLLVEERSKLLAKGENR